LSIFLINVHRIHRWFCSSVMKMMTFITIIQVTKPFLVTDLFHHWLVIKPMIERLAFAAIRMTTFRWWIKTRESNNFDSNENEFLIILNAWAYLYLKSDWLWTPRLDTKTNGGFVPTGWLKSSNQWEKQCPLILSNEKNDFTLTKILRKKNRKIRRVTTGWNEEKSTLQGNCKSVTKIWYCNETGVDTYVLPMNLSSRERDSLGFQRTNI